jgi:5-methylcytosine-specific restriction endonuclease McrA
MSGLMFPKVTHRKKKTRPKFKPGKPYCQYCGSNQLIDPPHHIELKRMGGSSRPEVHSEDNAITLCRVCHDKAHHRIKGQYISPEELRAAKADDEATS